MPKAWRSEYYVLTAHCDHGPYPTRELAEKIRARLAANGSEAQIHGSAQLVEYPAAAGTATLELKADDSQLQDALDRAEERIAGLQAALDSLAATDSLPGILNLHRDAIDALGRRLDAIQRRVPQIVREELRNAARNAANAPAIR